MASKSLSLCFIFSSLPTLEPSNIAGDWIGIGSLDLVELPRLLPLPLAVYPVIQHPPARQWHESEGGVLLAVLGENPAELDQLRLLIQQSALSWSSSRADRQVHQVKMRPRFHQAVERYPRVTQRLVLT